MGAWPGNSQAVLVSGVWRRLCGDSQDWSPNHLLRKNVQLCNHFVCSLSWSLCQHLQKSPKWRKASSSQHFHQLKHKTRFDQTPSCPWQSSAWDVVVCQAEGGTSHSQGSCARSWACPPQLHHFAQVVVLPLSLESHCVRQHESLRWNLHRGVLWDHCRSCALQKSNSVKLAADLVVDLVQHRDWAPQRGSLRCPTTDPCRAVRAAHGCQSPQGGRQTGVPHPANHVHQLPGEWCTHPSNLSLLGSKGRFQTWSLLGHSWHLSPWPPSTAYPAGSAPRLQWHRPRSRAAHHQRKWGVVCAIAWCSCCHFQTGNLCYNAKQELHPLWNQLLWGSWHTFWVETSMQSRKLHHNPTSLHLSSRQASAWFLQMLPS